MFARDEQHVAKPLRREMPRLRLDLVDRKRHAQDRIVARETTILADIDAFIGEIERGKEPHRPWRSSGASAAPLSAGHRLQFRCRPLIPSAIRRIAARTRRCSAARDHGKLVRRTWWNISDIQLIGRARPPPGKPPPLLGMLMTWITGGWFGKRSGLRTGRIIFSRKR